MTLFRDGVFFGPRYAPEGRTKPPGLILGSNIHRWSIVPATLDRDGYGAAQTLGGAGDLTLAGALVVGGVGIPDVPRCVGLYSSGNLSARTFTLYGYYYDEPVIVSRTGPNNSTVSFAKAVTKVNRIAVDGAVGTNVEAGTVDVFGFPIRVKRAGQLLSVSWNGLLARDTGTVTVADDTTPAIGTGDPRGTYTLSEAANGSKRLEVHISAEGLTNGNGTPSWDELFGKKHYGAF